MRRRTRFFFLRGSIILLFALLAGRVWYLQVVQGSYYKAQADTSKIRDLPVQAPRGIIYDASGRQLVFNIPDWNIEIVPHGIPSSYAMSIYTKLSQLLGGKPTAKAIAKIVYNNGYRPYAAAMIKAHVSRSTAMIVRQLHTELPGVQVDPTSIRQYVTEPQFSLSHIMGYSGDIDPATYAYYKKHYAFEHPVQTDQMGLSGLESTLDPYLHGVNGQQKVEVDSGERPVRVLQNGTTVPGDSVYLTINWKLQQQVAADLAAALQKLQVHEGVAIMEDVHTGKIISMVSLPSFNNNPLSSPNRGPAYARLLRNPYKPLVDLATGGEFAPGSIYKVITATAALESGVVTPDTIINDGGEIKPCDTCQTFHGWMPPPGLGAMNVVSALARSSDIYFYTVAGGDPKLYPNLPHLGGTRLAKWAGLFGLGHRTGVGVPGEASGFVPSPAWFDSLRPGPLKNAGDSWTIGYDYNSAIGQGFDLTTPIQMVNVAATIANGGTLYRPSVIDKIAGRLNPGKGLLKRPAVVRQVSGKVVRKNFISPETLSLVQQGMHESVYTGINFGTSFNVTDKRIDAAGKTGTAEDPPRPPHAWWIGYAPFNHPRVAVCVLVPNANSEGAYAAAPIAHKLLEDYFHLPAKPNWLDTVTQQLVASGAGTAQ